MNIGDLVCLRLYKLSEHKLQIFEVKVDVLLLLDSGNRRSLKLFCFLPYYLQSVHFDILSFSLHQLKEGRNCGLLLYMNRKELNIDYAGILPNTSAIFWPISAGEATTWIPHSAMMAILAAAVSSLPPTMAPA